MSIQLLYYLLPSTTKLLKRATYNHCFHFFTHLTLNPLQVEFCLHAPLEELGYHLPSKDQTNPSLAFSHSSFPAFLQHLMLPTLSFLKPLSWLFLLLDTSDSSLILLVSLFLYVSFHLSSFRVFYLFWCSPKNLIYCNACLLSLISSQSLVLALLKVAIKSRNINMNGFLLLYYNTRHVQCVVLHQQCIV